MNIRDKIKAVLNTHVETAAMKKPDPQTVLNIAKRFNKMLQPLVDKYGLKILTGKLVRGGPVYVLPLIVKSEDNAQDVKLVRFEKSLRRMNNTGPGTNKQDVIEFGDVEAYASVIDAEQYKDQITIDVVISQSLEKPFIKVKGNIAEKQTEAIRRGSRKLKAFMKENSIDLKTIKSMLKHL